jgi:hypothetical protein
MRRGDKSATVLRNFPEACYRLKWLILHKGRGMAVSGWRNKELLARRAIEDRGFKVHDANMAFHQNCPNIDLIVYTKTAAVYVQVK